MIHANNKIEISESFIYNWDEHAELIIRELDMPLGDGKGFSYKYAVGIEVYGRNYRDEYIESPNLFYSLDEAKNHYLVKLNELESRQDVRFLQTDDCGYSV